MGRSEPVRVGVVGYGAWGPNHVRNFSSIPGATVAAVCDRKPERLKASLRRFKDVAAFSSLSEALDKASLDAVVVATPTASHAAVVREALERGLHVLCEKPLCLKSGEAGELSRLAAEKNLLLMVGHVFLFNQGIVKLRQLVQERDLGAVQYLTCRRTNLGPIREDVNAVWDLASHDVSIANFLLGAVPGQVSAVGQSYLREQIKDIAFATLTYPHGVLVHIHVSWLDPVKIRDITIVGDRKMATWDDLGSLGPVRLYDKSVVKERQYDDFGQFQLLTREGDVMIPRVRLEEPLLAQARHFLAAMAGKEKCISDGAFAAGVVRVLEAIDRSMAENGAPVALES
ncbi:MAG: Gfo/Idh/MocA family protein [Planctomycetota bacterium]|jgi:predicted dehydrogenase